MNSTKVITILAVMLVLFVVFPQAANAGTSFSIAVKLVIKPVDAKPWANGKLPDSVVVSDQHSATVLITIIIPFCRA